MRHVCLLLLLLLLPLLACSSALPASPDGGGSAPICYAPSDAGVFMTGLTAPVPGCSRPGGATGVIDLADAGWAARGGVLVVPESAPGTPLPVVFAFHGAYASGEGIRARLGLEGPADGGAIFVYPNAVQGTWDLGPRSFDAKLVDNLLRQLSENYCIDPARISIAGFSAGAVFTLFLGCNVPQTFHASAAVAGTAARFDIRCCTHPISALFIHGTQDEAIPLFEGQDARNDALFRDGCQHTPAPVDGNCVGYGCPAPLAVNYCEWNGTHDVPDWAGAEIWQFLSAD